MAVELRVHKIEQGEITMTHVFYGETEEQAEERYQQHKAQCPALERAFEHEDTIEEEPEEIDDDDVPSPEDFEDDDEEELEEEGDESSE